jgi:glycosyltransferase involved in cell wall biosynthesis
MKIGLIGNVNNNNFALMRYFRDLGADAHLLLNSNDGRGALRHFTPDGDTWLIDKWRPFIHQTDVSNTPIAGLDAPWSWGIAARSWLRVLLRKQQLAEIPQTRTRIRETYGGYDRLLASGISPATLHRAGIDLDLFYPYGTGVEFVGELNFIRQMNSASLLSKALLVRIARRQVAGIRRARVVVRSESGLTQEALEGIGVRARTLTVPMVYSGEALPANVSDEVLTLAGQAIARSDFSVLHQARLMFRKPDGLTAAEWEPQNKNNDWLLRAFAQLKSQRPHLKAVLLMVAYGQDADAARTLARELRIDENVHWLPMMRRRDLMWLLARVTIGCGEFYTTPRMIWGGTGWESLACGKALLQGFNFSEGEFASIYGYPPPPMLCVRSLKDIEDRLLLAADRPDLCHEMGRDALSWFHQHNGLTLAKRWLSLILEGGRCLQ